MQTINGRNKVDNNPRNDAEYPMPSIGITRCHEKIYNTDLEAILTVSLGNDVKSADTKVLLSDWSVFQNFK